MGRSPRISIGVPVYNGEAFLAETLESLLGQTHEDLEIIVSDNASTTQVRPLDEHKSRKVHTYPFISKKRVVRNAFCPEIAVQMKSSPPLD